MGRGKASADDYSFLSMIVLCPIVFVLLVLIGYGIAKIVMGAVHLHECTIENLIPVYLIVSGISPILFVGFFRKDEDGGNVCTMCGLVGFLFNLVWLICGSVWVYPNYAKLAAVDFQQCSGNVTTDCSAEICNQSITTFAFATVTIDWFFISFWICFVIYLFGKLFRKY